jgi:DNA-binding PadR family transcriptional regulator
MSQTLGEFEQIVLFALLKLKDAAYGAAIRAEIEEQTGRNVNSGAVYVTLDRLENRGLVTSRWGEPTGARGGRRRRYYRLGAEGAKTLHRSYHQLRQIAEEVLPELQVLVDDARGSR